LPVFSEPSSAALLPSLAPHAAGDDSSGVELVWCEDLAESPHGEYWTRSTSGFRSGDAVSLSSVLEPAASIPLRYFLSPRACVGILRRAAARGRKLPPLLEDALQQTAMQR
jgi:hypothetical protein